MEDLAFSQWFWQRQVFRDKTLCQVVNWYIDANMSGEFATSSFQVQVVHCYHPYYLTTWTLKQDTLKHEYPFTEGHSTISQTSTATVMLRYWKRKNILTIWLTKSFSRGTLLHVVTLFTHILFTYSIVLSTFTTATSSTCHTHKHTHTAQHNAHTCSEKY